jgi:hypothetical protein
LLPDTDSPANVPLIKGAVTMVCRPIALPAALIVVDTLAPETPAIPVAVMESFAAPLTRMT